MSAFAHKIKVAIADDFLASFSKVPRKQQAKVMDFINKFRSNPNLPGLNFEKIAGAKDPNMRSVRIDQSYRGIVLKPASGNVYVLLRVDHHDDAYRWAENKVYRIHPETGSIQMIPVDAPAPVSDAPETADLPPLFGNVREKHLLRLGVPEERLALVRGLKTGTDLERAETQLPQEAYEALFFLSEGYAIDEVFRELEITDEKKKVDPDDYESALDNPDSRRRFFVVEDDLELAAILNAPLEKWRVFLHPSQQKLVERNWGGPLRVLGGAGTGKTVAAIHRAKWLAQNLCPNEKDRILITTFTRNLAADIRENLGKICNRELLRKIEVYNLDRWVSFFLKKNGYDHVIDYGYKTADLWNQAVDMAPADLGLEPSFYREEWELVVQPQGITSFKEYMKAPRIGRGTRLNRALRKRVWTVFEEYRALLNEHGLRENVDAMRDARLLIESKQIGLPYKSVIVDEAQDMGPQAFKLIRRMVPETENDLFIAGDAHQRIYRHKVVLGHCGIQIRGRSKKLRINYRTTEETRAWAVNLLKGRSIDDLDGGGDDQKGYTSLMRGTVPEIRNFPGFLEEIDDIDTHLGIIKGETGSLKDVCLVCRTNGLVKKYQSALGEKGHDTYPIRRSEPDDRTAPGLRLATMHRVKGLEFDHVIIAGVNDGIVPIGTSGISSADPTVRAESETGERALLYVAATRARKSVRVTSFGKESRFVAALRKENR